MAKRISKAKIAKAKAMGDLPTAGNGYTGGQRVNMADTNLPTGGFVARLIRRASDRLQGRS